MLPERNAQPGADQPDTPRSASRAVRRCVRIRRWKNKLSPLRAPLLLAFLLFSLGTQAQELRVFSKTTGEPIPFVTVYDEAGGYSALSDENGLIVLNEPDPRPGVDTLVFQHTAFKKLRLAWSDLEKLNYRVVLQPGHTLGDVVIRAASRDYERSSEVSNKIEAIDPATIQFQQAPTTADLLERSGQVFVQRSQFGGGSPVLRGFEANKILIVVDGVRMNNAIYRSGHLQNVITLDDATLESVEVVFGPGSSIYGSDAMGGVMHFYTKRPALSWNDSLRFSGQAYARYGTAANEKSGHLSFNIGSRRFASFTSASFSDFGDLRTGSQRHPAYPDWGTRLEYVERIGGQDVVVQSEDPNIQRFTGYRQLNLMQKFLWRFSEKVDFSADLHLSTSNDIPRYDRLTQYEKVQTSTGEIERLRFAEWYYGPQNWFMGVLRLDLRDIGKAFDRGTLTAAYQRVDEDRLSREFGNPWRSERREDVNVASFNADFSKRFDMRHGLQYGAEVTWNGVESRAQTTNIETGAVGAESTRYPDGGNTMISGALYVKHNWRIRPDLILSESVRYTQTLLHSEFIDRSFYDFPYREINSNNGALTGSVGLVWNPGTGWNLRALAASGFRAPNLDDVAKVFDSSPGTVIVPNENLGPEYAYNVEGGITKTWNERFRLGVTGWYTWLVDAIIRSDFSFNGEEFIVYDGELSRVQANVNAGSARIYGYTLEFEADFLPQVTYLLSLTQTKGREITIAAPLAHIPPVFGRTGFELRLGAFQGEASLSFNGWKPVDEYSPSGEDNLEEATVDGTPAWYAINLRAAYSLNRNFRFQLMLENLLDTHYRTFSSAVSAPGRNLVIGLYASF